MTDEVNLQSEEIISLYQERDYLGSLQADLQNLHGMSTLVYEILQNADDVKDTEGNLGGAKEVIFDITDEALIIENDGLFSDCYDLEKYECPWTDDRGYRCDFHRMQKVGGADKRNEVGTTGAFGIGFNSVYQITDHPEIFSNTRHLKFCPELPNEKKIEARKIERFDRTRFVLPWAFDENAIVRKRLRLEAVNKKDFDGYIKKISEAMALAAIFLKQVEVLEIRRSGKTIYKIQRVAEGNQILIESIKGGHEVLSNWHIFKSDFESEAKDLKRKHPQIEKKRQANVILAIPKEPSACQGRLFAVLPSESFTGLPIHINSDFFPTADRKR